MPNPNNANSLRPAQVLLSEADRALQTAIQERLSSVGHKTIGPTALFRAALNLLSRLEDEELSNLIDEVEARPSLNEIFTKFELWCEGIATQIGTESPQLKEIYSNMRPGFFSYKGRFAAITFSEDGRCLIAGMETDVNALAPGVKIPTTTQLFPRSLAVQLSMNSEGAQLAARAVIAWLTCDDALLPQIRLEFQKHKAIALR